MKEYIFSVIITSVLIALSELIVPSAKLKVTVSTVFTIVLLISLISPFKNVKFDDVIDVFSPTNEQIELDKNTTDYFTNKITDYYEKEFKMMLFNENLITEDVKVEICGSEIVKIKIYLSNLVIPENNTHINNIVIQNYVAKILGVEEKKVEIYA
jgi:hypothetical protein